jgi:arabinofuranosyltransferase
LLSDGIVDERAFYYVSTGILRWRPHVIWPNHEWSVEGEQLRSSGKHVIIAQTIGTTGYHAGPGVHIIDEGALADPLLARLPPKPTAKRPGHYFRALPDGYYETVSTGINQIHDPKLAEYYTHVHDISSGSLLSSHRLGEILAINLGHYDYLLP